MDKLLVIKGLASTLPQAQALIMAGKVIVEDHTVDKPKISIPIDALIRLKDADRLYVSRGGIKLQTPLDTFSIDVANKIVLDVGASTGGFTDCLLQRGAQLVYAVDVGYGQLAWKLREDPRVVNLERKNIRTMTPQNISIPPDLAVIDVSFNSLKKIWPPVIALLKPGGGLLSLIKPQFEVSREAVEEGGVVRDIKKYQEVIKNMVDEACALSLHIVGIMESPIRGQDGNREFFMYAVKRT